MRIPTLLQKIAELSDHPERRTAIDVDLMLDYTRVLYADLLEWRSKLPATMPPSQPAVKTGPTLDDIAAAGAAKPDAAQPSLKPDLPKPAPVAPPAPVAEPAPATNQPPASRDIRTLIGINDKYQIMSELFGNDKTAYEEALHHINAAHGAESAIAWLRERLWIAEEHGDAAQQFFDIVRRFFAN